MRALSPSTKGVSRTAKLAYHLEPVADAQIACTIQLLREIWRTRSRATDTLPMGGSEGLHEVWTMVMNYDQGWPKARGPAHVIRLGLDRAGAQVLPLFGIRIGDVTLRLAIDPP